MRRIDYIKKLIIAGCAGLLMMFAGSSCSTDSAGDTLEPADAHSVSLAEVIYDINAYQPPTGITGFEELRSGLIQALNGSGVLKFTAAPPLGSANVVSDLMVNNTNATLGWTYVNIGDYDQNSEVNAADLTPIAIHFGKTSASADWTEAQVADGDKNGEVNAADITPIAVYYLNQVVSYNIYTSATMDDYPANPDDPNGAGATMAGSIDFSSADSPPGFKTFTAVIGAPVDDNFYWVRPSDGLSIGAASNSVQYEAPVDPNIAPTADLTAAPTTGEAIVVVDFDATGSMDPDGTIDLYEWDWNGAVDGFVWESSGTTGTNQHTYDVVGIYNPVVRVTDNQGATDTATVQIEVTPPVIVGFRIYGRTQNAVNFPPTAIPNVEVHVEAFDGSGFTASGMSDADGMFEILNVPEGGDYYVYCDDPNWLWPPTYQEIINLSQDEQKFLGSNGPA